MEVRPGVLKDVQKDHMIPFMEDEIDGQSLELFAHRGGHVMEDANMDEDIVEQVVCHIFDEDGQVLFKVHWAGTDPSDDTWEPVNSFVHKYNYHWVRYCKENCIAINVPQYLKSQDGLE